MAQLVDVCAGSEPCRTKNVGAADDEGRHNRKPRNGFTVYLPVLLGFFTLTRMMKAEIMNKAIAQDSKQFGVRTTFLLLLLLIGTITMGCADGEDYYAFRYFFSSVYEKEVYIESVQVLSKNVKMGVRSNGPRSSIQYGRGDCTPSALLNTTANFVWWERQFMDVNSKTPIPTKPEHKLSCLLPFPEFDVELEWSCHFTLQRDNSWVGQYYGTKVKPVGKKPVSPNSRVSPEQQWIHVHFKNLSGKEIWFSKPDGKMVSSEFETHLFLENVPADGKFHGFSAHGHDGSIYCPKSGSKISGVWGSVGEQGQQFEFELPEFSADKKNWYCYFILDEDGKWSTVFEGIKE